MQYFHAVAYEDDLEVLGAAAWKSQSSVFFVMSVVLVRRIEGFLVGRVPS